jgi:hypothetical protein
MILPRCTASRMPSPKLRRQLMVMAIVAMSRTRFTAARNEHGGERDRRIRRKRKRRTNKKTHSLRAPHTKRKGCTLTVEDEESPVVAPVAELACLLNERVELEDKVPHLADKSKEEQLQEELVLLPINLARRKW